jgi:hypothetical protein
MSTKIMSCDCLSAQFLVVKQAGAKSDLCPQWELPWWAKELGAKFQDLLYGKGMRLHNERVAKGKSLGWTCTICGRKTT